MPSGPNGPFSPASVAVVPVADDLVRRAAAAEDDGDLLTAIELLSRANRAHADAALEYRLVLLRHRAFAQLDTSCDRAAPPTARPAAPSTRTTVPCITPGQLTTDVLRRHILNDGCVRVQGLADPSTVDGLVDGIDAALAKWGGLRRPYARPTGDPWFDPLPVEEPSRSALGRTWVTNSGGLLTADSPRMMFRLLETFEAAGLREVVRDYLGERPALSANKCTVRRVPPDTDAGWHQDGAFLGRDIRALNVWLTLTDCGRDAPGLDVLPRRLDDIVETGTNGAYFDWAVGPDLVEELARDTPIVRPQFEAGDALIFDDLFLHRTAADASMTHPRYAIETWFFAPSAYPQGHVPIVW